MGAVGARRPNHRHPLPGRDRCPASGRRWSMAAPGPARPRRAHRRHRVERSRRRRRPSLRRRLLDASRSPWVVIPGNHDVGIYGEEGRTARRLRAFRGRGATTASSSTSPAGDSSAPGLPARHRRARRLAPPAVDVDRPVAVFVHQPVAGDPIDGWEMPPAARRRSPPRSPAATCASSRPVIATFTVAGRSGVGALAPLEDNPDPRRHRPPRGLVEHVLTRRTAPLASPRGPSSCRDPSKAALRTQTSRARQIDEQDDRQHHAR